MEYKEGTYLKDFTEATATQEGGASTVAAGYSVAVIIGGSLFFIGALLLAFLPVLFKLICGIPLMIIAFLIAFSSIFKGHESARTTILKGECPYCGNYSIEVKNSIGVTQTGADCPRCKKRVVIQGTKFIIPESQRKKLQLRSL